MADWADRHHPASVPASLRFIDADSGAQLTPEPVAGDRVVARDRIRAELG